MKTLDQDFHLPRHKNVSLNKRDNTKKIYDRHVFYRTQNAVNHIKVTVKRNIYSPLSRGTCLYYIAC